MKAWEDYQHRAAELLRRLGFKAEVNDPLQGPNGVVHRVDVSARMVFAGVPVLWIVECKLWNRAVPKEKVSVLKDIVNDLGADRGLLMSERGFQSGAVNLAAAKNITLSSLDELRANATEQLMQSRVKMVHMRLSLIALTIIKGSYLPRWARRPPSSEDRTEWEKIRAEFAQRSTASDLSEGLAELASRRLSEDHAETASRHAIPHALKRLPSWSGSMWRESLDPSAISEISGLVCHLTMALERGNYGHWPVFVATPGGPKLAWSMVQLLGVIEPAVMRLADQEIELEAVRRGHLK